VFGTIFYRLAFFSARRPRITLVALLFITLCSFFFVSKLPIYTSRNALYPDDVPEVKRLNSFLKKFGSASDLMVVLEDAPRQVLETFAIELVDRLKPLQEVKTASAGIDPEFMFSHAYLAFPRESLDAISKRLDALQDKKVASQVSFDDVVQKVSEFLDNPPALLDVGLSEANESLWALNIMLEEWQRFLTSQAPPEDVQWHKFSKQEEAQRFLKGKGFFATRDGNKLIVLVSRKDPSSEFSVLHPFITKVKETIERLRKDFEARGLVVPKVGLTGLPAVEHEEFLAVQSDVALVVSTAAIFVILVILLFLRSVKRALVIFGAMALGTIWGLALAYFTVGHLTILTSAFTAILFGLGVDYGIFITSRIAEEIQAQKPLEQAIALGTQKSVRAVVVAGLTTVCIFIVMTFVPFKGFAELGVVAGCGVATVVLSAIVAVPPLYAVLNPRLKEQGKPAQVKVWYSLSRPMASFVVVAVFVLAVFGLYLGSKIPFDYDVLSLLPKDSEAVRYQRMLVKESDLQPEVIIFTAKDIGEARNIVERAKGLQTITSVQSLVDLFPEDATARCQVARRIGDLVFSSDIERVLRNQPVLRLGQKDVEKLKSVINKAIDSVESFQEQALSAGHRDLVASLEKTRVLLNSISEADDETFKARSEVFFEKLLVAARKAASVLASWRDAVPLTPNALPADLRDRFFASDGTVAIYAYPTRSVYDPNFLNRLIDDVYSVSKDATGFPTTHKVLSKLAMDSLRYGTGASFLVALFIILLAVRSLGGFFIASSPLFLGAGLMLATLYVSGVSFSYANIVGLPMVMGLAVDYGVWFYHRFREEKEKGAFYAASLASQAIMLAAGTTFAGVVSIMMASYRGMATMGYSLTIGLLCCFFAARFVAPALASLFGGKK
jgi:predicted RND superfamily exporter protein